MALCRGRPEEYACRTSGRSAGRNARRREVAAVNACAAAGAGAVVEVRVVVAVLQCRCWSACTVGGTTTASAHRHTTSRRRRALHTATALQDSLATVVTQMQATDVPNKLPHCERLWTDRTRAHVRHPSPQPPSLHSAASCSCAASAACRTAGSSLRCNRSSRRRHTSGSAPLGPCKSGQGKLSSVCAATGKAAMTWWQVTQGMLGARARHT